MPFKTFTSTTLSASDVNSFLMEQVIATCLSTARPAGVEGRFAFETDTDRLIYYNGSAWVIATEPWRATWTPTVTQSGSVAGTTNYSKWRARDGEWTGVLRWISSAAGTASNQITVSVPITLDNVHGVGGSFVAIDASTGTFYTGGIAGNTTTSVRLVTNNVTNYLGIAPAFTLASSDEIRMWIHGTY